MSKKILSVILAIVVMASLCMISASADEANVVNTKTGALHKGDTVTYTVSLKYGTETDLVAAINALVTYDTSVLAVDKKGSQFGKIGQPTINYKADGTIKFNAANGTAGFDYSEGASIATFKFDVIADAADGTEIKFNTAELFNVVLTKDAEGNDIPDEAKSNVAITSGCSATADVTCPHNSETDTSKTSDDDKATDTSKASDTEKKADEKTTEEAKADANKAPKTGDVATVVMMLVFAAAAVVVIAKKREA